MPDADLIDVYNASDVFVLCSKNMEQKRAVEGFGMVILEALACGVPVIGTASGGIPDAIGQGEGRFLIKGDSTEALSETLIQLYRNRNQKPHSAGSLKSWKEYCEGFFRKKA